MHAAEPARESGVEPLTALIRRLQDGDSSALEAFIRHTQGMAFRLARSLVHDEHLCQDVVQDVYLVVYREIHTLRDVKAFRTWFARIVLNRCRRLLRRPRPDSLEALGEQEKGPAVAGGQQHVELREDLKRALGGLSANDRSVLMLREVMQLSYEEIAAAMRVPVGTVRSRLSDARRRLVAAWHGSPPRARDGRPAPRAAEGAVGMLQRAIHTLAWIFVARTEAAR